MIYMWVHFAPISMPTKQKNQQRRIEKFIVGEESAVGCFLHIEDAADSTSSGNPCFILNSLIKVWPRLALLDVSIV